LSQEANDALIAHLQFRRHRRVPRRDRERPPLARI